MALNDGPEHNRPNPTNTACASTQSWTDAGIGPIHLGSGHGLRFPKLVPPHPWRAAMRESLYA
jgi:hypothetical protein